MTIREHVTSNNVNNPVPSEIRHLVSDNYNWYEIQNYSSQMNKSELRFFEDVNNNLVEVFSYAGSNGNGGIVIKKLPQRSGGGIITGGTKRFAQMYINDNAQTLANGMGVSLKPKDGGAPRSFEDDGKEIFNYDTPSEKYGSDVVKASATAAIALTAAKFLTSGVKAFKNPDTLKTIRDGFTGTLKGKPVNIDDVPIKKIDYKKHSDSERIELRKKFDTTERKKFNKSLTDSPDKITDLKKRGFTDTDIEKLQKGQVPKGYQVHHKLPLDDGGINDPSNLVLIKNSPFHKVITNEQSSLTKQLITGESKLIEFPVPKGNVYPFIK